MARTQPDTPSRAFGGAAADYRRFRPGYPDAAVTMVIGAAGRGDPRRTARARLTAVDLGAGTGKLTDALAGRGATVFAVERDRRMAAELTRRATTVPVVGSAERIPLASGAADLVTAGQAMHWFAMDRALPEMTRILRPGGVLAPMWNVEDTTDPFTAAYQLVLDRHVRSKGGAMGPSTAPFCGDGGFTEPVLHTIPWRRVMTAEQVHGLVDTLSYVLTATAESRAAAHADLQELIDTWPGPLELAETCKVWMASRR